MSRTGLLAMMCGLHPIGAKVSPSPKGQALACPTVGVVGAFIGFGFQYMVGE